MDHLDALAALVKRYPTIGTNGSREAHGRRRLSNLANVLKSRGFTRDQVPAHMKEILPGAPPHVRDDVTASVLSFWPGV